MSASRVSDWGQSRISLRFRVARSPEPDPGERQTLILKGLKPVLTLPPSPGFHGSSQGLGEGPNNPCTLPILRHSHRYLETHMTSTVYSEDHARWSVSLGFSLGLSLDLRPLTLWDSLIFLFRNYRYLRVNP